MRRVNLSSQASTLPIVEVHRNYTEPIEFAEHVYADLLAAAKRDFPVADEALDDVDKSFMQHVSYRKRTPHSMVKKFFRLARVWIFLILEAYLRNVLPD